MAKWSIRLTGVQTHILWAGARRTKKLKAADLISRGIHIGMTIDLRTLSAEELAELTLVLGMAGRPRIGNKHYNVTARAIRRKLEVVNEFSELSVVDRLAEVGKKRVRRRCQCYPLCHPPCGSR